MGWREAQARVFAMLVGKADQQMKYSSEIKKIDFFSNLHVPNVCCVIEEKNMLGFQKKKTPPLIFNTTFSIKARNENW